MKMRSHRTLKLNAKITDQYETSSLKFGLIFSKKNNNTNTKINSFSKSQSIFKLHTCKNPRDGERNRDSPAEQLHLSLGVSAKKPKRNRRYKRDRL
jgi:hypothetical protein